jgi:hypothetical protein
VSGSLDDFLPEYDVSEFHETHVAAAPQAVIATAHRMTPREFPLFVNLMRIRGLPALISGRVSLDLDVPAFESFRRLGFTQLADGPDEVVFGTVGHFWRVRSIPQPLPAEEFAAFAEPGFAKGAFNICAEPAHGGTRLSTETRVQGTDARARARFRRYWWVVMPWSALIRRELLRNIRRRAEAA